MAVFDKGRFGDRLKQKPAPRPKPGLASDERRKDWEDGFLVGYQSALDRYISIKK